jgi:hypothetical protein
MAAATALTLFVLLTLATVALTVPRGDRAWITRLTLLAWIAYFPILALVNSEMPFAGGGDDYSYFRDAATPFFSAADYFDLDKYTHAHAQPGYPWLLAILYQLVGHSLLALKLLNLFCYIALLPVWYRIGRELESPRLGRAIALAITMTTPLWFFWMFLLKDIVIVLLHSLFLLGVVRIGKHASARSWILVVAATLALIPFRAHLVAVNMAVLAASIILATVRARRPLRERIAAVLLSALATVLVLGISSDRNRMASLGVHDKDRVIGTVDSTKRLTAVRGDAYARGPQFPVLYLFTNLAGINPESWGTLNPRSLQGYLSVPWILVGAPFILYAGFFLVGRAPRTAEFAGLPGRLMSMRVVATPVGSLAVFVSVYFFLAWWIGDTLRYRLSDIPALAALATIGGMSLTPRQRTQLLALWIGFLGGALALFYLLREL